MIKNLKQGLIRLEKKTISSSITIQDNVLKHLEPEQQKKS